MNICFVVNTNSITSSRTHQYRYNLSAIKLNQGRIPGSKYHTGTQGQEHTNDWDN